MFFTYHPSRCSEALTRGARETLRFLGHRGPDDEGVWVNPPVAMGHRRLSIINLAGSQQSMADPGQRFALVYDGEIYNHKELRKRLVGKWIFLTEGDTEILLAGLVCHGEDFCSQMEGMWAFALWDQKERTLLMGCDRMGKKPLYYQSIREGLLCVSELLALAQCFCRNLESV